MKHNVLLALILLLGTTSAMSAELTLTVKLTNSQSVAREAVPVSVPIDSPLVSRLGGPVMSATVSGADGDLPYQLDDLDDDGIYDELFFLTDMPRKSKQSITVTFSTVGTPAVFPSGVYGSLSIRDRSSKNPKHLPITSLTVPASSNPYQYVFPHGPLLESEYVGFRIYCDHRQSVDYYGHRQKQVELPETAFYPSKEQKSNGYGDDVLYTGSTYGCGTMHGWDGATSVMFQNVRSRTYTLLASGPLRTIIQTVNKAWRVTESSLPVDVTTRYILCARHRDVKVEVRFSRPVPDLQLSTGVTDIVGSEAITDKSGLRGCWGTACAGNNPKVYDTHTVGLAVCVPREYYRGDAHFTDGKGQLPNQAYVALLSTSTDRLHYWFTATCDLETFGFADSKAWSDYLHSWKRSLLSPVKVEILSTR